MNFIFTSGSTLRELREQVEKERKQEMRNPMKNKKEKEKGASNKIKEIKVSEVMRNNNRTKILINNEFEP